MNKSTTLSLLLVIVAYVAISVWRASVTPFLIHGDACWYDMVARNLANGRGLVEDCVWYFSIPFNTVSHPIGNYFHPLSPIILAGFYTMLGVGKWAGTLPILIMDGILCVSIFFFCLHRLRSLPIAIFSALIFTAHKFLLSVRAGGGFPESYLMFFITLCCFSIIRAWDGKRHHYLWAAFWGALGYLSRNEGGHSLVAVSALFLWKEVWLPWRSKAPFDRKVIFWGLSIPAVFVLVVLPWEIRNHLLFGANANAAKINFFLTREYQDLWSYSQTFSLGQFLDLGWKKLLTIFLTSYYYKLETFIETTSWTLLLGLPLAWIALKKEKWPIPVVFYFLYSYAVMGALNHVSQNSGWNGVYVFLPFWIPMALCGVRYYFDQVFASPESRQRALVLSCGFIFLFHLADSARFVHRTNKAGGDPNALMIQAISQWFSQNQVEPPKVAMTHFPYIYTYHTGIPSVIIPTNDPIEKIWEVADKYQCTHLLLTGANDRVFRNIYNETEQNSRLALLASIPYRVTIGDGGDKIKIFRILPKDKRTST